MLEKRIYYFFGQLAIFKRPLEKEAFNFRGQVLAQGVKVRIVYEMGDLDVQEICDSDLRIAGKCLMPHCRPDRKTHVPHFMTFGWDCFLQFTRNLCMFKTGQYNTLSEIPDG